MNPFNWIFYISVFCPMPPGVEAHLDILPADELAAAVAQAGNPNAGAMTQWDQADNFTITMPEGGDARLLCHEIKHVLEKHWHPE